METSEQNEKVLLLSGGGTALFRIQHSTKNRFDRYAHILSETDGFEIFQTFDNPRAALAEFSRIKPREIEDNLTFSIPCAIGPTGCSINVSLN